MSSQGESASHWLTTNDTDYQGSAGSGEPQVVLFDPAARSKDLADRFAAGRLAAVARNANQVNITVLGRPQVDLGDSINVSDASDELINGQGYVRAIRHRFGDRAGFITDLRISLDGEAG
jgi:hypothetical protein